MKKCAESVPPAVKEAPATSKELVAAVATLAPLTVAERRPALRKLMEQVKTTQGGKTTKVLMALRDARAFWADERRARILDDLGLPEALAQWTQEQERIEKLRDGYEPLYQSAVGALQAFAIDMTGIPKWETVRAALTPQVLNAAERLQKKTLILVPPLSRAALVAAVNSQKGKYGIRYDTYTDNLDNDALYNDGKPEGTPTWEVSIVEGVTDIGVNEALQMKGGKSRQNHEQVSALLKDLKGKGLEALSGARNYLVAMIGALVDGQPIDVQNWTVLNANTVDKNPKSYLGGGRWNNDRIYLATGQPSVQGSILRLRGAVRVKL